MRLHEVTIQTSLVGVSDEQADHNDSGEELHHEDQLLGRHADHTKEVGINHLGDKDESLQSQEPTENRAPSMSGVKEVSGQNKTEDVTPDLDKQETDVGSAENAILGGDEASQGPQLDPITPRTTKQDTNTLPNQSVVRITTKCSPFNCLTSVATTGLSP